MASGPGSRAVTFLVFSRLSMTFRALGKKQSHTDCFCKNSQLYILRVLRQLYKQDDMQPSFSSKRRAVQLKLRPNQRARVKENKKKQTHWQTKTRQQRKQGSTCLPLEHHIRPAPCTWHFWNQSNPSTNHCKCFNIIYYILTNRRGGEWRGWRGIKKNFLSTSCRCKRTVWGKRKALKSKGLTKDGMLHKKNFV